MLWFWFTIGFIMTIFGSFLYAYGDDVIIGKFEFDGEILGTCILTIGGVIAAIMLLALGINWIITV